ncbi:9427_t:CDS:2, partial [Acaulospora morrowiae]
MKNIKHDVIIKELEQKNKELEASLAVVEQSSVSVDGQSQNDLRSEDANVFKKVISEVVSAVIILKDKEIDGFLGE